MNSAKITPIGSKKKMNDERVKNSSYNRQFAAVCFYKAATHCQGEGPDGKGCTERDIRVLDFDHIDPTTKRFNISNVIGKIPDHLLEEEIKSNTRIVCSNCHRRKHHAELNTRCHIFWQTFKGLNENIETSTFTVNIENDEEMSQKKEQFVRLILRNRELAEK